MKPVKSSLSLLMITLAVCLIVCLAGCTKQDDQDNAGPTSNSLVGSWRALAHGQEGSDSSTIGQPGNAGILTFEASGLFRVQGSFQGQPMVGRGRAWVINAVLYAVLDSCSNPLFVGDTSSMDIGLTKDWFLIGYYDVYHADRQVDVFCRIPPDTTGCVAGYGRSENFAPATNFSVVLHQPDSSQTEVHPNFWGVFCFADLREGDYWIETQRDTTRISQALRVTPGGTNQLVFVFP